MQAESFAESQAVNQHGCEQRRANQQASRGQDAARFRPGRAGNFPRSGMTRKRNVLVTGTPPERHTDVSRTSSGTSPDGRVTTTSVEISSGRELAEKALELGFYISLSGIVTFKKADALREIARDVPADRLLVETDSPYLAPVPYRGKQNEPAYTRFVAEYLATLRGLSYDEMAAMTTANFFRLFRKARP